jgi:hypothetical protein
MEIILSTERTAVRPSLHHMVNVIGPELLSPQAQSELRYVTHSGDCQDGCEADGNPRQNDPCQEESPSQCSAIRARLSGHKRCERKRETPSR